MREYTVRLAAGCLFLWMAAVPDLKTREIPARIPASFAAAALAANLFLPTGIDRLELWAGALPGAVFWLLSFLFKGKIGEGDGICLLVSGLMSGLTPAVLLAETALILAAMAGGIGMWTKQRRAGDKIPFIPFLAAAQSLLLAAQIVMTLHV